MNYFNNRQEFNINSAKNELFDMLKNEPYFKGIGIGMKDDKECINIITDRVLEESVTSTIPTNYKGYVIGILNVGKMIDYTNPNP